MSPVGFTIYRLLACAAENLGPELAAVHATLAQFAEEVSMPEGILFALASLSSGADPKGNRLGVEANLRTCDFFVQIFSEQPADPLFAHFVDFALHCRADPALPMRNVAVLLKANGAAPPKMQCPVYTFENSSDIARPFLAILHDWYADVKSRP